MDQSLHDDLISDTVEKYSDMVIRIAYQNLKNYADAEDVAQDAFIKLLNPPSFVDDEHMKAWLIRITINLCKDLKKSAWYRKSTPLIEGSCNFTMEEQGVLNEIWRLPVHYRNVVYLYYYEKYTVHEIAKILEIKDNTISSWLTRARKKLKNMLLEGGYALDS